MKTAASGTDKLPELGTGTANFKGPVTAELADMRAKIVILACQAHRSFASG